MRTKLLLPVALVAVTAMGVTAAIGIGDVRDNVPQAASQDNVFDSAGAVATLHRVSTPSAGASAASVGAAAKKAKKPKIQYFETEIFPINGGVTGVGDTLTCPGKRRVLGGYFGSFETVEVAETFSAPESKKSWFEGITNFSTDPDNAFIGIVCAKGVK
jgi:hypothetical protein